MATKTAATAPKKATRPEPVPFLLEGMAEKVSKIGEIWHKPINFDHAHVAAVAYVLVWDDGSCTRAHSFQTYNGLLTGYQADAILGLTGGVVIEDLSKYLGKLEKRGYTVATITKKARTRKAATK